MKQIIWDMFVDETKDLVETKCKHIRNDSSDPRRGVIVWFHADWCSPCREIEEDVRQYASIDSNAMRWCWMDIKVPKDMIEKAELKSVWGFETIPSFCVVHTSQDPDVLNIYSWDSLK